MISMPKTAEERKLHPVTTGVLDYFPDAILAIANVSLQGNEQHNPGQPLHWDRSKSRDEADALVRHLMERGTKDSDGTRHSAKMAWRALALLQKEIEAEQADEKNGRWVYRRGIYPGAIASWVTEDDNDYDPLDPETQEWVDFPTHYAETDSQADGHKDAPRKSITLEAAECEWCGYQQIECECFKWDKGL